jgi:hypothetical protein
MSRLYRPGKERLLIIGLPSFLAFLRLLPSCLPFVFLPICLLSSLLVVQDHPHRGMSTVTYMLDGKFEHEDFMGNRGMIGPGSVQWMIAGRGIQHAEMPLHEEGGVNPTGLQLWIDLPQEKKMIEPSYQEQLASEISTVKPSKDVEIRIISGESHGMTGKVRSEGGCWYFVRLSLLRIGLDPRGLPMMNASTGLPTQE